MPRRSSSTGAVITTGGLGPTRDDITKKIVADLFGAPLEFDETIWASLLARFARAGRTPVQSNRSQAEVPRGATILPNRWGTAPGTVARRGTRARDSPAGRPVRDANAARASGRSPVRPTRGRRHHPLRGRAHHAAIPESTLAERIGEIEQDVAPLSLAYLPGLDGVDLRLTAWSLPSDEADRRLRAGAPLLHERAGDFAYGEGDDDLAALVLDAARATGVRIGAAESCTGGLVGERLTEIPGSSDVFMGAVVCYDNALKISLLGVPAALIEAEGAVSEGVARAMAEGARRALAVDLSVAVTGIAGPGGGTETKPVGTVWLAMSHGGETVARRSLFLGNRHDIRQRAAQAALFMMLKRLRAPS